MFKYAPAAREGSGTAYFEDENQPLAIGNNPRRGCPKSKFFDKEIQYIEVNIFDEAIYCISY
jgi:hypothetical protein